jgi:foldase protein PrsA
MRSWRSVLSRALSGALLALALAACAGSTGAPPAATVSGSEITNEQLAKTAAVFKSVAELQQQPCGQTEGDTDTAVAACNRFSLGALIQYREAEVYARSHGVTVPDERVQKTLDSFTSSVGEDRLTAQLQTNGATIDDVRELVRLSLLQSAVAEAVTSERLTDEELRRRYESAIGDYTTLHVDHILVKDRAEAEDVYRQATAPGFTLQDFQALARQVSTDPSASQNGGELTSPASQLDADFTEAAEKLDPGEVSRPVQTQFGWHVIWMLDRSATPFAEARDQILSSATTEELQAWMQEQASAVAVDPSFGRYDPEQLVVVRITSTDPSGTAPTETPSEPVNAPPS